MNKHAMLDRLTIVISALFAGKHTFFCDSIDSPTFREHLQGVHLSLQKTEPAGKYEISVPTLAGTLDSGVWIVQWCGVKQPTIIYHHGSNERPFDMGATANNSFKNIFLSGDHFRDVNLITVRAPFHNTSTGMYLRKMAHLSNFVAMNAVSVKLIETLIQHYKSTTESPIIVAGISLGGWVTNLHHAYFNSAAAYIPLMAGAALDDVFVSSVYRQLTGELARQNPDILEKILNFENDFKEVPPDNVFPLLAAYDQIIRYERQRQCYGERIVNVLEKGHISGALSYGDLRRHIRAVVDNLRKE